MASTRNLSSRPSPSISTATAKTRSVIQDLQNRLAEATHQPAKSRFAAVPQISATSAAIESEEELERQLEAYFAQQLSDCSDDPTQTRDELRSRVIDGVVERILKEWAVGKSNAPAAAGLRDEVTERLIERVLQQLRASSAAFSSAASS